MVKKNIFEQFKDLAEWETNPFKKRAYENAAQIISEMTDNMFFIRNDYRDIPGIGDAINEKILQFKQTGFIKKWKDLSSEKKS